MLFLVRVVCLMSVTNLSQTEYTLQSLTESLTSLQLHVFHVNAIMDDGAFNANGYWKEYAFMVTNIFVIVTVAY